MKKYIFPISAVCLILALFAIPELFSWWKVDNFQSPLRRYRGDEAHYLAILNSAIVTHGPTANAYLAEQQGGLSQFLVFQSLAAFLIPASSPSIVWVDLVLKLLTAVLIFLLLRGILIIRGSPDRAATVISLAFVLVYGTVSVKGFALGFWFLPFLLGGMYLLTKVYFSTDPEYIDLLRLLAAVLLFTVHPVFFAMGGLVALLIWLHYLLVRRNWRSLICFLVWIVSSLALFFILFLPFLRDYPGSRDTLYRIVSMDTRIPFHLLLSARALFIILLAYLYRDKLVAFWGAAMFVGLNSYVLTGHYVANDHYMIAENFLAIMAAATVWRKAGPSAGRKILGWVSLAILGLSFFTAFYYLNFRLGYIGKWVPVLGSYFVISLVLLVPTAVSILSDRPRLISGILIAVTASSILYFSGLAAKEWPANLASQTQAQDYRALMSKLNSLPRAVVLADPAISDYVPLFSRQHVYWSNIAFSETVKNEDLLARWKDERLFFPGQAPAAAYALGTFDRCYEYKRVGYIKLLSAVSGPYVENKLCAPARIREADAVKIYAESRDYSAAAVSSRDWHSPYEIDWLVVDRENDNAPAGLIQKYFSEIARVGSRFVIYQKK